MSPTSYQAAPPRVGDSSQRASQVNAFFVALDALSFEPFALLPRRR